VSIFTARESAGTLPERIAVGLLAEMFSPTMIAEVLEAADAWELRRRLLPAQSVVLFVLVCWLFPGASYAAVMNKLSGMSLARRYGWDAARLPSTGSIAKARRRLGERPLRLLFERVGQARAGARAQRHQVVVLDTIALDVADTYENAVFFGRAPGPQGVADGGPRLSAAVLCDGANGALIGARYGDTRQPALELADALVATLAPGTLCVLGAGSPGPRLLQAARQARVGLLWSPPEGVASPPGPAQPDDSLLCHLTLTAGPDAEPVRVIRTRRSDVGEHPAGLVTTAAAREASAAHLAELYSRRWRAVDAFSRLTAPAGGHAPVLRSKTPEMVAQEFWAMLCVYQAIHDLVDDHGGSLGRAA
jgi:hypothetical protein